MKIKFYKHFGLCYNSGDFSSLEKEISKDCTYQSFDFLYVLKGCDKVLQELQEQSLKNLMQDDENYQDIYMGYYQKPFLWMNNIIECLIVVSRHNNKSIRILSFKTRLGLLISIVGLDPKGLKHVRGNKI